MRHLTTPEDFVGVYGPGPYQQGVLSEHLASFVKGGGQVRDAASGSGAQWAVLPGGIAEPVLCSEIIRIYTEDGEGTGRCGAAATADGFCPGHHAEYTAYMARTEAERAYDERAADLAGV